MRNIKLIYLLSFANGARFGLGVWVLYYLRFTNYAGIGLLEAVMIGGGFLLEVPTGAVADLIGRKRALTLAFAFFTAGYLILAWSFDFWSLCLAIAVFTVGRALYSGTLEAFVFDALSAEGLSARYARVIGQVNACRLTALGLACAAGGYLYAEYPRLPFLVSTAAFALGMGLTLFLKEPPRGKSTFSPRAALNQMRSVLPSLRGQLADFKLFLFLLVFGMPLVITEEMLDDVLAVAFGFSPIQLGWFFAGILILAAAAAQSSAVLTQRWGSRRLLLALGWGCALTLAVAPWLGMIAGGLTIAFRYGARAMWANIESEWVNRHAPSAARATYLSTFIMLKNIPYVLCAFALGAAMDVWGPARFALALALLMILIMMVTGRPPHLSLKKG